jgi:hypothetical protein
VPRLLSRPLTVILATALAGCAHSEGPPPSPGAGPAPVDSQVIVSTDIGSPEVIAAWSIYGAFVATDAEKTGRDEYATEVTARGALADDWKKARASKPQRDEYLDLLVEVRDAGFIREYALAYLAQPGWTLSSEDLAGLAIGKWVSWQSAHVPKDHRPLTLVTVRVRGSRPAAVPGMELPPVGEMNPTKTPCAELQPAIDRALGDWDRDARALRPVPLSIQDPAQTIPALARLAGDPRVRRDGVVLVSPRALETVFDAGFCAVDRGDWPAAEALLRRAVELSPASANVRGELVQTLIMEKRLDDADAQLDIALGYADSDCRRGMLWRKRGYILFDRSKLVDSYRAYARSLEFDPQSELAHNEMNLIVGLMRRSGTYDEKALAPAPVVVPGKMQVTNCR